METWGPLEWTAAGTVLTALVALAALLRPELESLRRRHRGRLEVYELGDFVEVGYGGAGPTLGLDLNLRAVHSEFFVVSADVRLKRISDGATHVLPWGGFRQPLPLFPAAPPVPYVETPAGFGLRAGEVRRLNIAFNDRETRDKMLAVLTPLRASYFDLLAKTRIKADPDSVKRIRDNFDQIYEALAKRADWREAWTELQRLCYWTQGDYEARLRIRCSDPSTEVHRLYRFTLSKQESDALFSNAVVVQRQNVGSQDWPLNFAYPKLAPVDG